jgi:serine/threonine protein kinase
VLEALVAGRLGQADEDALTSHLEGCPACRAALEGLAAQADSWAGVARSLREGPALAESALRDALGRLAGGPRQAADTIPHPPAAEADLGFLDPPGQPGGLGRLACYEVQAVLGRGGMGVVFRAFEPALRRVVAVKTLAPHLAGQPSARQRFLREARAAAAVGHEQVVAVHAVGEFKDVPFLVMEYVAGASLAERLAGGPLPLAEAVRIGALAARGLAAAHASGLVHRDVKPANILLEAGTGRVKLTDFGLAQAQDDVRLTESGAVAGTPAYMAPEQARGGVIDHRADLFSLGSVLYAMCTGRPPFAAGSPLAVLRRVADETPPPLCEANPAVPPWLGAVVAKLHAPDPAERFQSAAEVAELLERRLGPPPESDSWPTEVLPKPAVPPPASRRPFRLAACAGGLLVLLAAAGWWFAPSLRSVSPPRDDPPAGPPLPAPVTPAARGVTFRLDDWKALPAAWHATGPVDATRAGLRPAEYHYAVTRSADYLNKDFRFEVVFTRRKGDAIAMVGLGEVDRNAPYHEPGGSLYLRIHPPDVDDGSVLLANGRRNGGLLLGCLRDPGTHRVVIEKKGDAVTFWVDAANDGPTADDFRKTIADLRSYAPYLGPQETRLFFGNRTTYQEVRLTESPGSSPPWPTPEAPPPAVPALPDPHLPGEKEVVLEEPFTQVCTGGAGRYLVFHLPRARKLAVFDACLARLTHRIDAPDGVVYAAGFEKLLVAAGRRLQRWDLSTGKLEKTATSPGAVRSALLGSNARGPLLLAVGEHFLPWDVEKMAPSFRDRTGLGGEPGYGLEGRVSADGQVVVLWPGGLRLPARYCRVQMLRLWNAVSVGRDAFPPPGRWAAPSADGSLTFRDGPGVYDADMRPLAAGAFAGQVLLPTEDPRFFLAVGPAAGASRVVVCAAADRQPLAAAPAVGPLRASGARTRGGRFPGEPRVRYLPSANVLLTLPEGNDRVVMRPFNLLRELGRAGGDYLFVLSRPDRFVAGGSAFRYQMDVRSRAAGPRCTLEAGPPGMTVGDDGLVRWAVPRPARTTRVRATVLVRSASGKEVRHGFGLIVMGPPR